MQRGSLFLKIFNVFLWLKFLLFLTLNTNKPFLKSLVRQFIALCLFSGVALAIERDVPAVVGPIVDWQRCGSEVHQPNSFQLDFLSRLELFDTAYSEWKLNDTEQAGRWLRLAHDTFGQYHIEDVHGENGAFVLRGVLLRAECLAFAAVDRMAYRREEAIHLYEKSIKILQEVMLTGEAKEKYDLLPDFYRQPVVMTDNSWRANPWTGYEAVGTGSQQVRVLSPWSRGTGSQQVQPGVSHQSLPQLKKRLAIIWSTWTRQHLDDLARSELSRRAIATAFRPNIPRRPKQMSSSQAARHLLNELCPWGKDMYFLLKDVGLTKDLDFRILRPFTGEGELQVLTVLKALYNEYQDFFYSNDPSLFSYEVQPIISNLVLTTDQVPLCIKRAMYPIVGIKTEGHGKKMHRDVVGNLGGLMKKPIKWTWVGNPTYNIWYLSPRVFDRDMKYWLWFWFTAVKVYFGGPMGVIYDEIINVFHQHIVSNYGKGPVNVELWSNIVVESYDKGPLLPSLWTDGEWISSAAIARKIASPVFGAWMDQIQKDNFNGLDPMKLTMGKTYVGNMIPPVIIRSSVLGFEEPEGKYPRFVEVVRFFLVYPEIGGNRQPHQKLDLSKRYPKNQIGSAGWWKFPERGGSFEIITDFAPKMQNLEFQLTEKARDAIKNDDKVYAELWTIYNGKSFIKYASTQIMPNKKGFNFELFNANNPEAKISFEHKYFPSRAGVVKKSTVLIEYDNMRKVNMLKGLESFNLVSCKPQYQLKLLVNGKYAKKSYPIVLSKRVGGIKRKITGQLSTTRPGIVQLNYEPEINLLVAKVTKGSISSR